MSAKPQDAVPDADLDAPHASELGSLLRAPSLRARATAAAVVLGRIAAIGPAGAVSVELPGAEGARAARWVAPLSLDDLIAAKDSATPVVLAFENGDPALPIILAVLQPQAHPDTLPEGVLPESAGAQREAPPAVRAQVDGQRVRIVAEEEIVLECGSASITLRRNGRVVVRGTYVETHSEGTNRIKGGQVRIN